MSSRTLLTGFLVCLLVGASVVTGVGGAVPSSASEASGVATRFSVDDGLDDRTEVETWLDETVTDQLEEYHVPGAAVVLVRDGEVRLAKGYGYADLESRTPVDANETVFGVGSTAKLLTWTAVMQGVEEDRLALDRDVNAYLGDSPVAVPDTYPEPVTLEHLGTHTAGFEEVYGGTVVDDPSEIRPLGETLAANRPLRVRPPGQFVAYSNYGTALGGHVLAEQYDTTFAEFATDRILEPLEMDDSTYEQPIPDRLRSRLATGYSYRDGEYHPEPIEYWGLPPEGGALRATATDMGTFMLAHLDEGEYGGERILEAETVREMHRRHFSNAPDVPEQNGMGYGFIEMNRNDERIVGHWGTTAQFMSLLALFPERDTGLFVVYNAPGGSNARFDLLDAFVDRYYPEENDPTPTPPEGAVERASPLTGDYRTLAISHSSWHRVLGVTETVSVEVTDEGYLRTADFSGDGRSWVEVRPGVYEALGSDDTLVFRTDDAGRGTHLSFGEIGSRTYGRLAWYESVDLTLTILVGGVLAFVSALVLGAGAPLRRRLRERSAPIERERRARALLGVVSLVWILVAVIFLLALLNFDAEVASPSLALRIGKLLPYVGLAGTVAVIGVTAVAWREEYWTRLIRLHYSVVAVVAVLFAWQLYYLRILSL